MDYISRTASDVLTLFKESSFFRDETWTFKTDPVPEEHRLVNANFEVGFIFCTAVILFIVRRLLSKYVFEPLAVRWKVSQKEKQRFVENAWFSVYYPSMVVFAFYALWDTPWLWDRSQIYLDFPEGHMADKHVYPLMRKYCLVALAFYSQALFGLIYVDERMKDFGEMVSHHIATIALLVLSSTTLCHRVGSLIVLLHDVGDVFLYNAKFFHAGKFQTFANICFFLFTVTFFFTRLVLFPVLPLTYAFVERYRVLYPSLTFFVGKIPNITAPIEVSSFGICVNGYCVSTLYSIGIFLLVLVLLHMYWFTMIVRLLIKTLSEGGNVKGDPRVLAAAAKEKKENEIGSSPPVRAAAPTTTNNITATSSTSYREVAHNSNNSNNNNNNSEALGNGATRRRRTNSPRGTTA